MLLSMRIISTSLSPELGVASATPANTDRAAISASVGSLFPLPERAYQLCSRSSYRLRQGDVHSGGLRGRIKHVV